ncbi:membrane protein [Philodulcilactobacillus myokoensis]|uniref:Membrane protein n=1 Tax=Philodulcilactobacillus myokoensis TaxID=2929573 RepID=A0A9W6B0E4_9LACO|nr:VIT family protein [Philodulcilactobacillus myokoensis]GLB46527.1 membrane protein [Philodulcilactobacillus myokoensis]
MKKQTLSQKINIIRASVMGANDGIVSVAGIVIGVAGAAESSFAIFISGIAGMLAGTVSMAMGEYVSVNTEKDSQRRAVMTQKKNLRNNYNQEYTFVKNKYMNSGIKEELANRATNEMMTSNPLVTTVRERFGFNVNDFTSPYAAAIASMLSFPTGSVLPLAAILLSPANMRIIYTFIAVLIALAITGYVAALIGNANKIKAMIRNVISGIFTMVVLYVIGNIVHML